MADQALTPDSFMAAQKAAEGPPAGLRPVLNPDSFMQSQIPSAPQRASDAIPTPEEAVQQTTNRARALVDVATRPQAPNVGTMSPHPMGLWERFAGPVREGAIGRALGMSTETAEARREDPSTPLLRFEASTPHPGAARGAAEFASGLTTPENLLLAVGSGGLGALDGVVGKGVVSRLVSAGFSAGMLHNAYQQIPALREAWNKEDWPQVRQQLVKLTLGTGMAALGARHAIKGGPAVEEKAPPGAPEQQYTSTGQPIRSELTPDTFMQQTAAPKENITHEETQVTAPQGRPGPGARAVQPGTADAAAGQAQAIPATQAQVERAQPGWVGNIPTSDIKVDAPRFQFKANVGQGGAGEELRDVTKYDPEKAGVVAVWKDPANGQTYVVNGHHRVELAQRTGAPEMAVRYLDAENAQQARTKGALINIAEGRGESTDAAKVFRDSGMTQEDLAAQGVSIKGKIAKEGMGISKLAQPIFDDVIDGSLTPARGAVIGTGIERHADQKAVYDLIKQQEKGGRRLTNDQVEELIRLNNRTPTKTESTADNAQGSMFGIEEMTRSLLPEKSVVSDYIRKQLGTDKKLFGAVGNEAAAARLGEGGNVINAAANAEVAERANRGGMLYDKLSSKAGPLDGILDRAAQQIANGENANDAKQQAYRDARAYVLSQADQLAGVPKVGDSGAEGLGSQGPLQADSLPDRPAVKTHALSNAEQLSAVTPAEEAGSRADAIQSADKLLGDQLGAQIASGGPVKPSNLKPAENRGLFDEPKPETGGLFDEADSKADHPPEVSKADDGVYFGSGLGVLEPLFREAKAEGDALRLKRNAALDAVKAARAKPEQVKAGEKLRAYFTSERDLWAARANQALDIVSRNVLPKIQDREALGIMREFRHKPVELLQFIEGTHPFLDEANGGSGNAMNRLEKLQPVMRNALRMMKGATDKEAKADRLYTNIAEKSLQEGMKGGWLASRWKSDEYVPHMVNPKGEGEVATPPSTEGRAMGKIGKFFGFGQRRADLYPTMVHAVADGLIPKTLDPSAAFTVHADRFAQARATHLLEGELAESGLGKWGNGKHIPEGWVQLAKHSDEFKKSFASEVPDSRDPEGGGAGELRIGTLGLYVPKFLDEALSAITAPDYTPTMRGFAKLRTAQRGLKQAILGLSGFHLLTEHVMAKADVGPSAMYRALKSDRGNLPFLMDERDLIASGGTTSIQGSTMDAFRNMKPGTIPTRGEVFRGYMGWNLGPAQAAEAITRLTFDNVQRKFKVVSFALHRDAWLNDNPTATPEQFAEAKKGIASYVNGVYGGLHWENMGWPRAMVEVARALFLAPDWSGSNIALGKYAFNDFPHPKEIVRHPLTAARSAVGGIGRAFSSDPLAGAVTKESAQARLARAFWVKQAVQGLMENQALSLLFSGGKLSHRPFQVYQGKDKDGQDVYQNVVFRGSAGDLISLMTKAQEHGPLAGAGIFVGSKAAPFAKLGVHMMTGHDDLGRGITPKRNSVAANTVRSILSVGSDVSPIPLTLRSIGRTILSDQSDKYKWSERMLGLFGPQAQHVPPSGMHMTSHGLRDDREKPPRSFFEQVTGHKAR